MYRLTFDDMLKLKAVVLYIINRCEAIDYFHLFKCLYFADRDQSAKYGKRIIADTFCALKNGPVPSTLFDAIKVTVGQKKREDNDRKKEQEKTNWGRLHKRRPNAAKKEREGGKEKEGKERRE